MPLYHRIEFSVVKLLKYIRTDYLGNSTILVRRASMTLRLDPWGHFAIESYEKLFSQFGIQPIDNNILSMLPKKHRFFNRKIIFGHRDFDKWLKAYKNGEKVAVLTGLMPSGHVHLGHLMLFEELRYYQEIGVHVSVTIADAEAYAVRRIPRNKLMEYAREYIMYAYAIGLDPEKTRIYFQTNSDTPYYRLIQMFSRKVTMAEMEAIYGELEPGKIVAAFTQVADILHLQLPEYGGYKWVLVPVGADQDPHLRLTRDIADRFENELGLKRPASTYHKFIRGLDGNKMSSSKPEYAIFLSDDEETIRSKVMKAFTGGRVTAEEQRKYGGEPWKCTVYDLYMYYLFEREEDLRTLYRGCLKGLILCGEDKKRAAKLLIEMIREIQEKAREFKDVVEDYVKFPRF